MLRIEYKTIEDKEMLMKKYEGYYLIGEQNLIEGNFLIFDTQPTPQPLTIEEQFAEKDRQILLLKAQNQVLAERTEFHEEVLAEIILTITS